MTIQDQINDLDALQAEIERLHRMNETEAQPIKQAKPLNWFTDLNSMFWALIGCAALVYTLHSILSHITIVIR